MNDQTTQQHNHESNPSWQDYFQTRSELDPLDNYRRYLASCSDRPVFPQAWTKCDSASTYQPDGAEIYEMELLEEERRINRLQMESRWMSRLLRLGLRHRKAV